MEISGVASHIDGAREGVPLSERLRNATYELHREAERTGIIRRILHGEIDRPAYALLLRSLLPVYRAMEGGLAGWRARGRHLPFTDPRLSRTTRLEADLAALAVAEPAPPPPAAAIRYERRVADLNGDLRLLGHAYTRYLGDLSGGQIMARLLARKPGLAPGMLTFYAFPGIDGVDSYALRCRQDLDRLDLAPNEAAAVIDEARRAFALNIDLSRALDEVPVA